MIKAGGKVVLLRVKETSRKVVKVWSRESMREVSGGSQEGFYLEGPAEVGDHELVMILSSSHRRESRL